MRSRFLILFAVLGMLCALGVAAAAVPVTPQGTFVDDDGSVHEGYIEAVADAGITVGCNPPDGTLYCPLAGVTRAQMATFLVRAAQIPPSAADAFVDDQGSVHEANIDAVAAAGISLGCNPPDNDMFCPNDIVSRGQMAAFLTRTFGYVDDRPMLDRFVDDDGSTFEAEIEALASAGVTLGCNPPDNDRFCPNDPVTRGQMATFLGRALSLTPTPPPAVWEAHFARVYFALDQPDGGPYLAPVARYLPGPATPEDAVDLLLEGPTAAELAQTPAFSGTGAVGAVRLGPIDVTGGVATVDLSGQFDDGGGTFMMGMRLAMLTFTVTAFDGIDRVMLELDGVPVDVFSSEGIIIDDGLTRDDFITPGGTIFVPEVFVEDPAWWQYVEGFIPVSGISRAFEATIEWELYDGDGMLLASGFETTGGAGPEFGPMNFEIFYELDRTQLGTLVVFTTSAADGSIQDLRETAVWLLPMGSNVACDAGLACLGD